MNPIRTPPPRAYAAGVDRSQKNVRVVYTEDDIQRALTAAYKSPKALSVIRLGDDIRLSKPVTITPPEKWRGIVLDGGGQFKLTTGKALDYMISTESAFTTDGTAVPFGGLLVRDLRIEPAHAVGDVFRVVTNSSIFNVSDVTIFVREGVALGYAFALPVGSANVAIDGVSIGRHPVGSSIAAAFRGTGASIQGLRASRWTLNRCAVLTDVATLTQCHFVDVVNETSACAFTGAASYCMFVACEGLTSFVVNAGTRNLFVGWTYTGASPGTLTVNATDAVLGIDNYTVTGPSTTTYLARDGSWSAPAAPTAPWTIVTKLTTQTKVSDTTLAADDELVFSMAANTTYRIRAVIFARYGPTADFKYSLTGPASPTLVTSATRRGVPGAAPAEVVLEEAYTASTAMTTAAAAAPAIISIDMLVQNGANAGTFAFNWAQNTSTNEAPYNPHVLKGSYIEYAVVA